MAGKGMGATGDLAFVVLAAGKGTRMRSSGPKVLQPVCGRPILLHALALADELGAKRKVVVAGTGWQQVREALPETGTEVVRQTELRGTAHAVLQARELLADHAGPVLVMYGDHSLYRVGTFAALIERHVSTGADLSFLTCELADPTGYGRIVRDAAGGVERIVEEGDASDEIRRIRESNVGVYVSASDWMFDAVSKVEDDNPKGEFYLTDIVALALSRGEKVETSPVEDASEALQINTRAELAAAEAVMRRRIAARWMDAGVTFVDPERTYVDVDVEIGQDSVLEPGCVLRGATRLGAGCRIAAGAVLDDARLGDEVWIKPHCWIEGAELGPRCIVGPSAHLRPGTALAEEVRIGNFVEVKNSRLGRGTKADHLSYVGDADVGEGVTIGCGAITVNYDGQAKHRTTIGDGAFVGCNSNLIAPVAVEPHGYVSAGSTVTNDVPGGALAVARARQRNIEGWRQRRFGNMDED